MFLGVVGCPSGLELLTEYLPVVRGIIYCLLYDTVGVVDIGVPVGIETLALSWISRGTALFCQRRID